MVEIFRRGNLILSKEIYTEIFLKNAGLSCDEANIKYHMYKWWFSTAASTGLRLSDEGYQFLTNTLKLQAYEVPFADPLELSPSTIVFLSKHMECPYLLKHSHVTVFSERKSIELYLFSGDIRRYGLVKAIKAQQALPKTNK